MTLPTVCLKNVYNTSTKCLCEVISTVVGTSWFERYCCSIECPTLDGCLLIGVYFLLVTWAASRTMETIHQGISWWVKSCVLQTKYSVLSAIESYYLVMGNNQSLWWYHIASRTSLANTYQGITCTWHCDFHLITYVFWEHPCSLIWSASVQTLRALICADTCL